MISKVVILYMLFKMQFPTWCKAMIIVAMILDLIVLSLKSYAAGKGGK